MMHEPSVVFDLVISASLVEFEAQSEARERLQSDIAALAGVPPRSVALTLTALERRRQLQSEQAEGNADDTAAVLVHAVITPPMGTSVVDVSDALSPFVASASELSARLHLAVLGVSDFETQTTLVAMPPAAPPAAPPPSPGEPLVDEASLLRTDQSHLSTGSPSGDSAVVTVALLCVIALLALAVGLLWRWRRRGATMPKRTASMSRLPIMASSVRLSRADTTDHVAVELVQPVAAVPVAAVSVAAVPAAQIPLTTLLPAPMTAPPEAVLAQDKTRSLSRAHVAPAPDPPRSASWLRRLSSTVAAPCTATRLMTTRAVEGPNESSTTTSASRAVVTVVHALDPFPSTADDPHAAHAPLPAVEGKADGLCWSDFHLDSKDESKAESKGQGSSCQPAASTSGAGSSSSHAMLPPGEHHLAEGSSVLHL
jgi:hypothetical protein